MTQMASINNDWLPEIKSEFTKPYYNYLYDFIKEEYTKYTIYPKVENILNAYNLTPLSKVKLVIIGQDPYPGKDQAHGLSFSSKIDIPRSLANIYKELATDVGCYFPAVGDLTPWAEQGVFLLNTILTVRANDPNSHKGRGWETFTDRTLEILNTQNRPIVYLLWGRSAQAKSYLLDNPKHLVLTAAHPSPFSANRGFFGCKHFSQANHYLSAYNMTPIDWQIK